MMNKKRLAIAPINSPIVDRMELQRPNTSPATQETTTPSTVDPTTTTTTVDTTTPSTADPTTTTTTTTTGRLKTSIHVNALDSIANVNSLFTMAVFIGFSLTVPQAATATSQPRCVSSLETVRRLIVFEVISFSFFLFSSIIAQSLRLSINLLNGMDPNDPHRAEIDPNFLKYGLFGSAIGSVLGCLFLMLSVVDFIQVKLGRYSCGGKPIYAMVTLVILMGFALLIYVSTAIHASFFVEATTKYDTTPRRRTKQTSSS